MIRLILAALALFGPGSVLAQDAAFLAAMREDVERLELDSNTARGEALQGMLEQRGIAFTLETFEIVPPPGYPRSVGTNVVVTLGDGARDIVVGGHYDAAWLANGRLSRGAIDNAGSAVILTRLAETLLTEPLNHRLRVVFFDMEEIGLIGSRRYVETHADDDIAALINLDVNGYGDTVFYGPIANQQGGLMHRSIESACGAAMLECVAFERYPASDYLSFQRAGIPVLSLAVLPAAEVEELRVSLNGTPEQRRSLGLPTILGRIHSPDDTSAHIDPAGMALTLRATLELVRVLDR